MEVAGREVDVRDGGSARSARQWVLVGSGCLALSGIVCATLLALNWSRVDQLYQRASGTVTDVLAIQRALQSRYRTSEVTVGWRQRHGTANSILVVQLVNPPFLEGLAFEDARPQAQEIALVARGKLRDPAAASVVEVQLTKSAGFGVRIATKRIFRFAFDELAERDAK
jgi:hypothetical protein